MCRFPPAPDAVCRLEKSPGHTKAEIYFTDPDFKVKGSHEATAGLCFFFSYE